MIPGIVAQAVPGSGEVVPSERWWRIVFINNNGGNAAGNASNAYIDIYQAGLYTEIGGANWISSATETRGQPYNNPPSTSMDYTGGIRWNNAGNQGLLQGCFIAFKIPTGDDIVRFSVQGGGTYGPFDVYLESSWDGETWEFEYGYCRVGGSGLQNLDRLDIDWSTYTNSVWLLQPHSIYNYTNLGIMEIEMAATIGGADQCNGGTAFSTGNTTYPASNAFDNNTGTLCGSVGLGRKAYIYYQFPAPVKVDELRIYPHPNERPSWGSLCANVASGSGWYIKKMWHGIDLAGSSAGWRNIDCRNPPVPPLPDGAHRYWRVRPENGGFNSDVYMVLSLMDWLASGVSLVGSGTPISANNGITPANAFDGNDSTYWYNDGVTRMTWLGYDFGSAVLPDELQLKTRHDSIYTQFPPQFVVEYSDDTVNWFTKKGFAPAAPTANLQLYSFDLAA